MRLKRLFNAPSKCPNCGKVLSSKPTRKVDCPHCGETIRVRKGELISEEDFHIHGWIDHLEFLGVSMVLFNRHRDELSKQFGFKASVNDTVWRILNRLIINYGADNAALEQIYRSMSKLVSSEGKDPTPYLLEAEKARESLTEKYRNYSTSLEELSSELNQILYGDTIPESASEKEYPINVSPNSKKSINDSSGNALNPPRLLLGHDELVFVCGLRRQGKLDQAEEFLKKAEPSPAVLDELRKTASARAKTAKKNGDWKAVFQHLNSYTDYANKCRDHCIKTVNQEPPVHTKSDTKLLLEAENKLVG